jgi:hypothetical protein
MSGVSSVQRDVMHTLDHALTRIEMEYREMPDLKLTFWQARRLWNLDDEVCEQALAELVAAKFLYRTPDGRFVRRGLGPLCGWLRESSPRCDA